MAKVRISSPTFQGTPQFKAEFDPAAVGWWRTRHRLGGDKDGEFTLAGDFADLSELFHTWLGCHVSEFETELPWRGFVWGLSLSYAGITHHIGYDRQSENNSPMGLYNAVRAGHKKLLTNGGFETGGDEDFTFLGWDQEVNGDDTITVESTASEVASGSQSARIENVNNGDTYLTQTVTVKPHETYRFTFLTRGDDTEEGRYAIRDESNVAWLVNIVATDYSSDSSYKKITAEFVTPDGCTEIKIYLYAPSLTGTVWYDDVELVRINADGQVLPNLTDWATNDESIARYGRRELIFNAGDAGAAEAVQLRDEKLEACAWPAISAPAVNDDQVNSKTAVLVVECVGYWATAFFRYITVGEAGLAVAISDLITSIITTDCDWLTIAQISANSINSHIDPKREQLAGELLEKLIGDQWRLTVGAGQAVVYEAISTSPSLFRYGGIYAENRGAVIPIEGQRVMAGIVVQSMDWPASTERYAGWLPEANLFVANEWEVSPDGRLTLRG